MNLLNSNGLMMGYFIQNKSVVLKYNKKKINQALFYLLN